MSRIALLFPGQGSQYVGMGKSIYEKFSIARNTFEEANDVLGFNLKELCFEGDMGELTKTQNTQPAILTVSVAAFRVYMQEIGEKFVCTAGHSLGEYSALTCVGAIDFATALKIVQQRGIFMQESIALGVGAMSAISGIDKSIIEKECSKFISKDSIVVISSINSPDQTVISGHKTAVRTVEANLEEMGAKVYQLNVSAPFHSPLMQTAAEKLKKEMTKYIYKPLQLPVISNVTALPHQDNNIIDSLYTQMIKPVKWQDSIDYIKSQGIDLAVEMGPQIVLKNLMRKNAPEIMTYPFEKYEDLVKLRNIFSKNSKELVTINNKIIEKCIQIAVTTKNRNWDNDEYQNGVIEPLRRVQKMQDNIEKEGRQPINEEMQQALSMLHSVFITKKVSVKEQIDLFNEVLNPSEMKLLFPNFEYPSML